MFEEKTNRLVPTDLVKDPLENQAVYDPKQRRLMLAALALLLVALGLILWKDWDFWFPSEPQEESDLVDDSAPAGVVPGQPATGKTATPSSKPRSRAAAENKTASPESQPVPPVVANRTVLPPLEVEVVAGDVHRTIRPGSNSVKVDLQPGTSPQPMTDLGAAKPGSTVTTDATERVRISADTAQVVNNPVNPDYPLLARQMKVQGSVILQALIGKDGLIQDLHVVSGPPILAKAAEEAVRQWHFKPHYQDNQAVETLARITVNFTISTN